MNGRGRAASRIPGVTGACRQRTGTRSDARDRADLADDRLKLSGICFYLHVPLLVATVGYLIAIGLAWTTLRDG